MKHTYIKIFSLLILALFLGCAKETSSTTQLSFRSTWPQDSGRTQALAAIIADFNTANPNLSVETVGGNENLQEIITLLNSGSPNDVMLMPYRHVKSLGKEGYLTDLSAEVDHDIFYPELLNLAQVEGKYYGIPVMGHSMAFVYNKSIVEPLFPLKGSEGEIADVSEITTWDAFETLLKAIQNSSFTGAPLGMVGKQSNDVSWMTSQFVYSFGGSIVSEDGTQAGITEIGSQEGLAYYKYLADNYGQKGWNEQDGVDILSQFRSGQIAIEIQGPWGVTEIWKQAQDTQFPVGAFSLTQIDNAYAEVGPLMLVIPSDITGEKLEAAQRLISFFTQKDTQEKVMDGEYDATLERYFPYRIPARNDMEGTKFFQENPEFLAFIEGFKRPSIDQPTASWAEVKTKIYEPALSSYLAGDLSMEEFATRVSEDSAPILNQ